MSLKKDRFALVVLLGWLMATLSTPLIVWGYPLFALMHFGGLVVVVIAMIIVYRIFIMKVKRRQARVILQIALLALPIITNMSIQKYQLNFENPSRFHISADGGDKLQRIVVWTEPKAISSEESLAKENISIHQSGLYRDQSWFFIPGIALRCGYEKVGQLMLAGKVVTKVEHDTVSFKLFDKVSASLYHVERGNSYYNNVSFMGDSYDSVLVHGRVVRYTVLKFVPVSDTGCRSAHNHFRLSCTNTGELQIGNSKSLSIDREWIKKMLHTNLEK